MNIILEEFNYKGLQMFKVSEKIGRAPVFSSSRGTDFRICTKRVRSIINYFRWHGFIAVLLRSANLKKLELRKFSFAAPFCFSSDSAFYGRSRNAAEALISF